LVGVANDDGVGNVPSYRTAILHMVSSVESSYRITIIALTRGGQQPMVDGGCTIVACWHVTPALLVVVASVRCVRPLPTTLALSGVCTLGTCEP
jgi:hypothetical protein